MVRLPDSAVRPYCLTICPSGRHQFYAQSRHSGHWDGRDGRRITSHQSRWPSPVGAHWRRHSRLSFRGSHGETDCVTSLKGKCAAVGADHQSGAGQVQMHHAHMCRSAKRRPVRAEAVRTLKIAHGPATFTGSARPSAKYAYAYSQSAFHGDQRQLIPVRRLLESFALGVIGELHAARMLQTLWQILLRRKRVYRKLRRRFSRLLPWPALVGV